MCPIDPLRTAQYTHTPVLSFLFEFYISQRNCRVMVFGILILWWYRVCNVLLCREKSCYITDILLEVHYIYVLPSLLYKVFILILILIMFPLKARLWLRPIFYYLLTLFPLNILCCKKLSWYIYPMNIKYFFIGKKNYYFLHQIHFLL